MLPADAGGGADLRRGLEALKTFKKRVDGLLANFEGSAGSSAKVAAHTISRPSFSGTGDFAEATGLHTEYERVHEHITTLSKTLRLQIEALQIAVQGADIGFDNLEEDLRRRFWEIRTEVNQQHAAAQSDVQHSNGDQAKAGY
ncbi:hypothetical protein AAW14_34080 [Streptomyces hygroscopicus]|uniref:hypothetical protein n=1 Tax=Streptomyces hygroscopicus TaxID=1912 RepID=UPI00223F0F45|nr:hypothetical protein [Streptomyces hygroscopicus]MCW7946872.1 hypothetical protein [Streptomyces hygroscopicus]